MTHRHIVLSHFQTAPLLAARKAGKSAATSSPDLGLSTVTAALAEDGLHFPDGAWLTWETVEKISRSENQCFLVEEGGTARAIQVFSETTNWVRSLMPTSGAPTMLVAGFPMHRIKDTDPYQDTLKKVAALAPVTGRVLDTATGLGYTAIECAKTADSVVTVELDPAGLEVARFNPWSRELFENPKITRVIGDVYEKIREFPDAAFDRVLHDPPTFSLAGELYSAEFYRQIHRVLARNGRLFHYVGDPDSKLGGRTTSGVLRRLQDAGFRRVVRRPEAFGVVAYS